jgi:multicomponent Na+:H+ antiporter subunit D
MVDLMPPWLPPGTLMIVGGMIALALPRRARAVWCMALPVVSLAKLGALPFPVSDVSLELFGLHLLQHAPSFGAFLLVLAFHAAAFASALYMADSDDSARVVQAAGTIYAGGAIGAVLAGDLLTVWINVEITTWSSAFIIWAARSRAAEGAALRYLVAQELAGATLLAGIALVYQSTGSLDIGPLDPATAGGLLILLALGLKAALPLAHSWLPDAYPKAGPAGMVWLAAFTTKLAVILLGRTFLGTEALLGLGAVMALAPFVWAIRTPDWREALAWGLVSQLGLMVMAIGLGGGAALLASSVLAVGHVAYSALLIMAAGTVLAEAGTARLDRVRGLIHRMPFVAGCALFGILAMALPGLAGYAGKAMLLIAALDGPAWVPWVVTGSALLVFVTSGVRPFHLIFMGPFTGPKLHRSSWAKRAAMTLVALFCAAAGILLPVADETFPQVMAPDKVMHQIALLAGAVAAYAVMVRLRIYPPAGAEGLPDVDRVWRRWLPWLADRVRPAGAEARTALRTAMAPAARALARGARHLYARFGPIGAVRTTGGAAFWIVALLAGYLLLYYI